jgi:hypothetical protein
MLVVRKIIAECFPLFWEKINEFVMAGSDNTHNLRMALKEISGNMWTVAENYFGTLIDKMWPDPTTETSTTLDVFEDAMYVKTGMILQKVGH